MRTTQEKWLAELDKACAAKDVELIVDKEYANTGTLRFQNPDDFNTSLTIPFSFQGGKLTLGWMAADAGRPAVFTGRPNPKFAGFENETLDEAIGYLLKFASGE